MAPILYGLHALLAGLAFPLLLLGAKIGYTFSHGFIDYALFYAMDTRPWLVLVFGPLYALIYYVVFRVEELIGAPVALLGTSPERDDTILVKDPFQR